MIFFKVPKVVPSPNLTIAGNHIEQVNEFNFLGITLDRNITWKPQITKIAIKIVRRIGVLNKLKHIFPQHILLTIYNSLIQPNHIYGLYHWGINCKRLKIFKKKTVRIFAFRQHISDSTPIFKDLKYYSLKIYIFIILCIYISFITKILIIYYHHISIASHHITCIIMKIIIMTSVIKY